MRFSAARSNASIVSASPSVLVVVAEEMQESVDNKVCHMILKRLSGKSRFAGAQFRPPV